MHSSLKEFRKKEIINITDGTKIGYVDDISFELVSNNIKNEGLTTSHAVVTHLIVRGRYKFFGILGKNDDLFIPWEALQIVGQDTLIVSLPTSNDNKFILDQEVNVDDVRDNNVCTERTMISPNAHKKTQNSNSVIDFIKNIF